MFNYAWHGMRATASAIIICKLMAQAQDYIEGNLRAPEKFSNANINRDESCHVIILIELNIDKFCL